MSKNLTSEEDHSSNNVIDMRSDGMTATDCIALLHYIYTGHLTGRTQPHTATSYHTLRHVGERYNMSELSKLCTEILSTEVPPGDLGELNQLLNTEESSCGRTGRKATSGLQPEPCISPELIDTEIVSSRPSQTQSTAVHDEVSYCDASLRHEQSECDKHTKLPCNITTSLQKSTEYNYSESPCRSINEFTSSHAKSIDYNIDSPEILTPERDATASQNSPPMLKSPQFIDIGSPTKSPLLNSSSTTSPTKSPLLNSPKRSQGFDASSTKSPQFSTTSPIKSIQFNITSPIKSTQLNTTSPIKSTQLNTTSPMKSTQPNTTSPIKSAQLNTTSPIKSTLVNTTSPIKSTLVNTTLPKTPIPTSAMKSPECTNAARRLLEWNTTSTIRSAQLDAILATKSPEHKENAHQGTPKSTSSSSQKSVEILSSPHGNSELKTTPAEDCGSSGSLCDRDDSDVWRGFEEHNDHFILNTTDYNQCDKKSDEEEEESPNLNFWSPVTKVADHNISQSPLSANQLMMDAVWKTPAATVAPTPQRMLRDRLEAASTDSPVTPYPNYEAMVTPQLMNQLARFGVRKLSKKRAVRILRHIYEYLHPLVSSSSSSSAPVPPIPATATTLVNNTTPVKASATEGRSSQLEISPSARSNISTSSQESTYSQLEDLPEESMFIDKDGDDDDDDIDGGEASNSQVSSSSKLKCKRLSGVDLEKYLHDYITSHPHIHEDILQYTPLDVNKFHGDIRTSGVICSMAKLMDFLDKQGITFTMPSARQTFRSGRCRIRGKRRKT